MFRVGEVARVRAFYKQGMVGVVPNAAVTVDYTDESGNLTAGASPSAGAITGEQYFELTPDAAGLWLVVFKTAATNVNDQEQPTVIEVDAAAFTPAGIATAVWAAGARTLTSFGTLVASIVSGVWNALRASYVVVGSMGEALGGAYTKVIAPGAVKVVSPGPDLAGVVIIIPGDAYDDLHANQIPIPIPTAPDVSAATHEFTVDGVAFSPAVSPIVSGVGAARIATVELTAAQTEQLRAVLVAGGWIKGVRVYWRIVSNWGADSPLKPQTIAAGEIRRPAWDTRTT